MTDPALAHRITHRHIEVFRAVMTAGSATGAADLLRYLVEHMGGGEHSPAQSLAAFNNRSGPPGTVARADCSDSPRGYLWLKSW